MTASSGETSAWTAGSRAAEDLRPEFCFLLSPTAYVGDPNNSEQIRSGEHDRPLSLPSFTARDPLRPTAAEALGHEAALAAYYRELMELTGRRPRPGAVGYWLRLRFVSDAVGSEVDFPWWDRVSDAAAFFRWLRSPGDDADFFDCDQGWELRAARIGSHLQFQYGDLGMENEFANLSVDRMAFLARLDVAEADIRLVIGRLAALLDIDPWS